jgi:hypothetical protein
MRKFALILPMALCACTSFQYGATTPPTTKTIGQQEIDAAHCERAANREINSTSGLITDFLLGTTIIGVPLAIANDRHRAQLAYAQCMAERGYTVAGR